MFESTVHDPGELAALDDAALIDTITDATRITAAVEARRLAALAEFAHRRCDQALHPSWGCDDWDNAAAEIAAALTLHHGRAMNLMDTGLALRDRLPAIGALLLSGRITAATATTIAHRTALINDPTALTQVDTDLADAATGWGPLSNYKLDQAIDTIVDRHDPDAVRRARTTIRSRDITIGDPRTDRDGLTALYGRLATPDAALLDATLTAMAKSVCDDDPRTLAQRRADALGALAAHTDHLICACEDPDCTAKTGPHPATHITIHILANAATATPTALARAARTSIHGTGKKPRTTRGNNSTGSSTELRPEPGTPAPSGIVPGRSGATIPAPLLADLIAHGARIRTVTTPTGPAEPRYRPSARLDEFIRSRDITCRHPGCDRPATDCDLDHIIARNNGGPTHPANLGPRCRLHHLLKTFWPGWTDTMTPDGTLTITTPTGHSYTQKPLSHLLFPDWNTTTAPAPPPRPPTRKTRSPGATVMMPTRKQPRSKTRAQHITTERAANATQAATERAAIIAKAKAQNRTPPPDYHDPPPF